MPFLGWTFRAQFEMPATGGPPQLIREVWPDGPEIFLYIPLTKFDVRVRSPTVTTDKTCSMA